MRLGGLRTDRLEQASKARLCAGVMLSEPPRAASCTRMTMAAIRVAAAPTHTVHIPDRQNRHTATDQTPGRTRPDQTPDRHGPARDTTPRTESETQGKERLLTLRLAPLNGLLEGATAVQVAVVFDVVHHPDDDTGH